jgi:hypothetical protein
VGVGGWAVANLPSTFSECSCRFVQFRWKLGRRWKFISRQLRLPLELTLYVSHWINLSSILKSIFNTVKSWLIKTFTFFCRCLLHVFFRKCRFRDPKFNSLPGEHAQDTSRVVTHKLIISCLPPPKWSPGGATAGNVKQHSFTNPCNLTVLTQPCPFKRTHQYWPNMMQRCWNIWYLSKWKIFALTFLDGVGPTMHSVCFVHK